MNILVTGAAGTIGRRLRRDLAGRYPLVRLLDIAPLGEAGPGEEIVATDLGDLAGLERAFQGIDAVVHMAAVVREVDFESILAANVVGTYNVYEAARRAGVRRVIFGSSNHAVGFVPRGAIIDHTHPPRPDSRYGLSKCWGEDVARLYADKHGIGSLCIRIGNAADLPGNARSLSIWISPRDLTQLVTIGIEHPDIHHEIVYGVSANAATFYDNANAHRLGYRPLDSAEDHADFAMKGEAALTHTPAALAFQGGLYCGFEFDGPLPARKP